MPLKYIERRIFRVILPTGKFVDIQMPVEECPSNLLSKLGLSKNYIVLYGSEKLPMNKKFSELKVGRELKIKKAR